MSLIMMSCPLCNKNLAWDSSYPKKTLMPTHWADTTGGMVECNGEKQKSINYRDFMRKKVCIIIEERIGKEDIAVGRGYRYDVMRDCFTNDMGDTYVRNQPT